MRQLSSLWRALWGLLFYLGPIDPEKAARWRELDLLRMSDAPGIDPHAVGQLLGAGLQHRIYEYHQDGEAMVLKVLIPNRWLRFPTADEARADLELVCRFLEPFALEPAEIIPLTASYAIKQRRLASFRAITPEDLKQRILKEQLVDLVRRNREMMRQAGRSLDYLGREGQRKCRAALVGFKQTPTMANVVVELPPDGSERIRILDTDLENFHPGSRNLRDLRSSLAARAAVEINRFLVKRFFGIDILNPN